MSKQWISEVQREAIWQVYKKKCFYTEEPLPYNELEIDHVIPEHLANKPEELESLKTRLGLPPSFDIYGYENLVPCKNSWNGKKGGRTFGDRRLQFFLDFTEKKKPEIEKKIEEIKKQNSRINPIKKTAQHLEAAQISLVEMTSIIESYKNRNI